MISISDILSYNFRKCAFIWIPLVSVSAFVIPFVRQPTFEEDLFVSLVRKPKFDRWEETKGNTLEGRADGDVNIDDDMFRDVTNSSESTRIAEYIFIQPRSEAVSANNLLNKESLLQIWQLMDTIKEIRVANEQEPGELLGLEDLCVKAMERCLRLSISDYWESEASLEADPMPRTTLRRDVLMHPREFILGKFEMNDFEVIDAESTMITILIESVSEQVVKAWEAELEIACIRARDNANSTLHINTLTSSSIERSIIESIRGSVVIIIGSLSCLAVGLCFMLRSTSHLSFMSIFLLVVHGMLLIVASILLTGAISEYQGKKLTPFNVQAIPTFLIGLGVDFMVMIYIGVEEDIGRNAVNVDDFVDRESPGDSNESPHDPIANSAVCGASHTLTRCCGPKISKYMAHRGVWPVVMSSLAMILCCMCGAFSLDKLPFVQDVLFQLSFGIFVLECLMLTSFFAMVEVFMQHHVGLFFESREVSSRPTGGPIYIRALTAIFSSWPIILAVCTISVVIVITAFLVSNVETDINILDLVGKHTDLHIFLSKSSDFFPMILPITFELYGADFSNPSTQAEYRHVMKLISDIPEVHPLLLQHHWLNDMISWVVFMSPYTHEYSDAGYSIPGDKLSEWLAEYMRHPIGVHHKKDLIFNSEPMSQIIACRARALVQVNWNRLTAGIGMLKQIQDVASSQSLLISTNMHPFQSIDEAFHLLTRKSFETPFAAACGAFLLLLLTACYRKHLQACLHVHPIDVLASVLLSIASATASLRWTMHLANFELHFCSFIYVVFVIVLTTEYITMLVVFLIQITKDETISTTFTPAEALMQCLILVAPRLLNGALTTAVAIGFLGFSSVPLISEVFCQLGIAVICIALMNAVCTFPAALFFFAKSRALLFEMTGLA